MQATYNKLLGALVAFLFVSATPLLATVIPPSDLNPGDPYQLVFVTAGVRDATSSNIADYNGFVTQQANLSGSLPSGLTWHAIASTSTVDARDNAPTYGGIPVYNTHGQRIADGGCLYLGNIQNPIDYDQYGNLWLVDVWTGSYADGTKGITQWPLGGPSYVEGYAWYGDSSRSNNDWISTDVYIPRTTSLSLYALGTIPEPATMSLLLVLGGVGILRRRKLD